MSLTGPYIRVSYLISAQANAAGCGVPLRTGGPLTSGIRSSRWETSPCKNIYFVQRPRPRRLARFGANPPQERPGPFTSGLQMLDGSWASSLFESCNSKPTMWSWARPTGACSGSCVRGVSACAESTLGVCGARGRTSQGGLRERAESCRALPSALSGRTSLLDVRGR